MTPRKIRNRAIYIVVTCTGTRIARAIRVVTRMPYCHASVSADENLSALYSFSRSFSSMPLPATFNLEYVGKGLLGKYSYIPCEIYAVPVTEEQYAHFLAILGHFTAFRKRYSYSLIGLLRVKMQIEKNLRHKFVCSQFVAYVLHECGITLQKKPCLYSPDDLRFLPQARLVYRGELNSYYRDANPEDAVLMPSAV